MAKCFRTSSLAVGETSPLRSSGRLAAPLTLSHFYSSSIICPIHVNPTDTQPHGLGEGKTIYRIGIGHDTHRLAVGGPLRLGGIEIPHDSHLVGHSDADVLLHAITDALLGAAAMGDIGEMFPDTPPENRGRDSADMLARAYQRVMAAGYRVVNLDCIVFAERPKLSPHKTAIKGRIAAILGTEPLQVGLKAKTGEGLGEVGNQRAVMAQCVALLEK